MRDGLDRPVASGCFLVMGTKVDLPHANNVPHLALLPIGISPA